MDQQRAAGLRLLQLACPFIERRDDDGLASALNNGWSSDCLALLLTSSDYQVVAVAARCLGLVGHMNCCQSLARLLAHEEPDIVAAAEQALWNLWFRDGGAFAQQVLYKISLNIAVKEVENVVPLLTGLIQQNPGFAEAYHQRAQAHFMEDNYASALKDARRALQLNPLHFSAAALCGHCLSCLGRFEEALAAYRGASTIYPSLTGIRTAIQRVRERLSPAAVEPQTVIN